MFEKLKEFCAPSLLSKENRLLLDLAFERLAMLSELERNRQAIGKLLAGVKVGDLSVE